MSFHKWMEFKILINPSFGFQKQMVAIVLEELRDTAVTSMELDQPHQHFQAQKRCISLTRFKVEVLSL